MNGTKQLVANHYKSKFHKCMSGHDVRINIVVRLQKLLIAKVLTLIEICEPADSLSDYARIIVAKIIRLV